MTYSQALLKFGFPAPAGSRNEIQELLSREIALEKRGEGGDEMLRTLCLQLFSIGALDDSLLIWEAKRSSFDAGCGLDIQFLCGAGLAETKQFLAASSIPAASAVLKYLIKCEQGGDFADWTPQSAIKQYRD